MYIQQYRQDLINDNRDNLRPNQHSLGAQGNNNKDNVYQQY